MGRRAAIAIGVSKAGNLPTLTAAIKDARKFHHWAGANAYDHTFLVDDEAAPVTREMIKAVVEKAIVIDPERLLIFFSGHGTSGGTGDYWLLSNYHTDSDEAVNVTLSFNNARQLPIGQIGVFADACRAGLPDGAFISGGSIFPRQPFAGGTRPKWDIFYATALGDIAQEVSAVADQNAFGIFSRCLLEALEGAHDKAFERRTDQDVICSDGLALWLQETVPLESGRTPNARVQIPDITAGWLRPDDIYLERASPATAPSRPLRPSRATIARSARPSGMSGWTTGLRKESLPYEGTTRRDRKKADDARQDLAIRLHERERAVEVEGRDHFETRRGLTIYGTEIERAIASYGPADLFREDGVQHVRGEDNLPPYSLILETREGTWIPTVILPGFVGVITIEGGLATALNYQSIERLHYNPDARVEELLRRWTALMSLGRSASRQQLTELAGVTRYGKHDNPALGLLAGYAYERAGEVDEIDSIVGYFADRRQPVLFDLALLSSFRPLRRKGRVIFPDGVRHHGNERDAEVAGSFPLLARGWALLDPEDTAVHEALPRLRSGILDSLWISLAAKEGRTLANLIKGGKL